MTPNDERSFACPKCDGKVRVIDSRAATVEGKVAIRRRRICQACNYRFTTFEVIAEEYLSMERMKAKAKRALAIFRDISELNA